MANYDIGGAADWGARGPLPVGPITQKTSLGQGLGGGAPQTTPSSEILHKMMLNLLSDICYLLSLIFYLLSYFILRWLFIQKNNQWTVQFFHTYSQGISQILNSVSVAVSIPYSAMLFGHDCQTTWQNMEMGKGRHSLPPSKQPLIQNNL